MLSIKKERYILHVFLLYAVYKEKPPEVRESVLPSRKLKSRERNKIKRRVREIFSQQRHQIKDGMDLVLNIKAKALTANYYDLKKDFEYILKKSRLETPYSVTKHES